jgi:hypothetical protein
MSTRWYILDKDHNVIPCNDLRTWAEWSDIDDNRRVALTDTPRGRVSTVFLGIDHAFGRNAGPLFFETMVFVDDDEDGCWRCATWDEAVAQHAKVVSGLSK